MSRSCGKMNILCDMLVNLIIKLAVINRHFKILNTFSRVIELRYLFPSSAFFCNDSFYACFTTEMDLLYIAGWQGIHTLLSHGSMILLKRSNF